MSSRAVANRTSRMMYSEQRIISGNTSPQPAILHARNGADIFSEVQSQQCLREIQFARAPREQVKGVIFKAGEWNFDQNWGVVLPHEVLYLSMSTQYMASKRKLTFFSFAQYYMRLHSFVLILHVEFGEADKSTCLMVNIVKIFHENIFIRTLPDDPRLSSNGIPRAVVWLWLTAIEARDRMEQRTKPAHSRLDTQSHQSNTNGIPFRCSISNEELANSLNTQRTTYQ